MRIDKMERMSRSLLDGVEFGDFSYQGGSSNTPMKRTGFPFSAEEVADILSTLFYRRDREEYILSSFSNIDVARHLSRQEEAEREIEQELRR